MSKLREQLQAAFRGESLDAPEVPAEIETPEAPAAETPAQVEAEAPPSPDRDENGRFKAKEQQAPEGAAEAAATPEAPKEPETAKPEAAEAPQEPIRIPPSLPAAVKAQWADLKPEVQQAFHKLEDTVQNAKAEWGRKGERLNRYDEIMAPRKDKLDLQGVDEFTFLKTLCAAQDYLERDPVGGIQYLARSYGVDLRQFGGGQSPQLTGAEGQQAPTAQPEFAAVLTPLQQQVQALQQQLQQFSQHSEAEKLAQAQAEVDAFAANPANIYFENVRPMVAKYLETGQAQTLQDAYDMAVWAHPETREILIQAQTQNAAKATQEAQAKKAQEEQQKAKAQAAAKAAGSVTGAPTPGASAPAPGSTGNLREDLLAAKRLVESRA